MNKQSDQKFLELAVANRLLSESDAQFLEQESSDRELTVEQLAIRQGHLTAIQVDIIHALATPEDVAPGYRVVNVLGVGGFGVVYRAIQTNMSREVALKTIPLSQIQDSTAPQRFEREASIIGQLRHPNIVAAYDFGMHNERLFLSMEMVEGSDLDHGIERFEKMGEFTTWHILRQVVMALAYAAEHGITHRDIKPGNLMITVPPLGYAIPDGVPMIKVTDFGLACISKDGPQHQKITMANTGLGTPSYVAPEQLSGKEIDSRADIYSLGATAFHMLSGQPPLAELKPMEAIINKLSGNEEWIQNLPAEWSAGTKKLIAQMSAFEPSDRIADHKLLLVEIDRVLSNLPASISNSKAVTNEFRLDPQLLQSQQTTQGLGGQTGEPTLFRESAQVSGDALKFAAVANSATQATQEFASSDQATTRETELDSTVVRNVTGFKKWWRSIATGGLALIVVSSVFFLFPNLWSPANSGNGNGKAGSANEVELLRTDMQSIRLFDGFSIDFNQKSTGKWETAEDAEGGRVLSGNGTRVFKCQNIDGSPLAYFQFNIGFQFHQSEEVSLVIQPAPEAKFEQVVIANGKGIAFGNREISSGEFEPFADYIEWPKADDVSSGYNNVRIERHKNFWRASLDSQVLGQFHDESLRPMSIKLVIDGGSALLENIFLRELAYSPTP